MEQRIAVYLRLSLEDVDLRTNRSKDESNSVGNQRLLIRNFIAKRGKLSKLPVSEFCDDGFTGTNFDRPQFQTMLELVKGGEISCVIVKDLSRFGRNYLEVGDYLEHIFPFLGVRFIAVNDSYDSDDYIGATGGMDIAFRNLIHQKYSQDLSEKVKSAMHMKMAKGKYVNHAPFGYMKSPHDKHRIIPDPATAPIVRAIFDEVIAGRTTTEVAADLNARRVPTPIECREWKERVTLEGRRPIWNHRTILRIIRELKYTGAMVNHTRENKHIRDKNQRRVPPSEWIITEGMHEGIVSKEEFDEANSMISTMSGGKKKPRDFTDRVYYCGHCGRKLRKSVNYNRYFACETSLYQPDAECGNYRWEQTALETVVLEAYKGQLLLLEKRLEQVRKKEKKNVALDFVSELHRLDKALETCNAEKLQRYEQYRSGEISKDAFIELKAKLMDKAKNLEEDRCEIEKQRVLHQQTSLESEMLAGAIENVMECVDTDETLKMQMYADIERVRIFSNDEIKIQWKFEDWFADDADSASEYERPNAK